jgi:hypothetical protein
MHGGKGEQQHRPCTERPQEGAPEIGDEVVGDVAQLNREAVILGDAARAQLALVEQMLALAVMRLDGQALQRAAAGRGFASPGTGLLRGRTCLWPLS